MFSLTFEGYDDRLINAGCLQLGGIAGSVGRSGGSEVREVQQCYLPVATLKVQHCMCMFAVLTDSENVTGGAPAASCCLVVTFTITSNIRELM